MAIAAPSFNSGGPKVEVDLQRHHGHEGRHNATTDIIQRAPNNAIANSSTAVIPQLTDFNEKDLNFIGKFNEPHDSKNEATPEFDQEAEYDSVRHAPEVSCPEIFENEYFKVTDSETAGLGAFAKRPLKYGDVILRERPLFVSDSQNVFAEFAKLTMHQKNIALGLHANEQLKPGTPKIYAIWTTNW